MLQLILFLPDEDHDHGQGKEELMTENLEELKRYVDEILEVDDKDKDGYINWAEFKQSQPNENH